MNNGLLSIRKLLGTCSSVDYNQYMYLYMYMAFTVESCEIGSKQYAWQHCFLNGCQHEDFKCTCMFKGESAESASKIFTEVLLLIPKLLNWLKITR